VSVRRRPKRKRPSSEEAEWEAVRKYAWLRELLTSSSEEEEPEEKKARTGEDRYKRFEEFSKWLVETIPAGCGQTAKPIAELSHTREGVPSRPGREQERGLRKEQDDRSPGPPGRKNEDDRS
jgi:hypothetical protein